MKWFKHDSDCFMSEGVSALIDIEGFAGYGRWMRLLEIVAFKMDKTNRCHAEYSIQKWSSLLGLKQKKLVSFLKLTENQLKTKVVYYENIIKIEIPNLLNKRDNYTSDLEVSSKRLPSKEVEVEVEVEVEKDIRKIDPGKKGLYLQSFQSFYTAYPKHKGKDDALKAWVKLQPSEELLQIILKAIETQKRSTQWQRDNGEFIPYPATWLNKGRWKDEVERVKAWNE